jgi:hypothetical protein
MKKPTKALTRKPAQRRPVEAKKPAQSAPTRRQGPKLTKTPGGAISVEIGKTIDELLPRLRKSTGTHSHEVAIRVVDQIAAILVRPKPQDLNSALIQAVSTIKELAPRNLIEAQLCTQLVATHETALMFLAAATREDQTVEGRDSNVLRATRLMRLHLEQIEALQKLRGKAGHQRVVVEHVNVHAGGQAVVGAIAARGEGV